MGTATTAIRARRQSRKKMVARVKATTAMFWAMLARVPVTTFCTPATSLLTRLMICPVWVTV